MPPVADQLPLEPLAHHADQLLDQLVGQLRPADRRARGSARCRDSPGPPAASCSARCCAPALSTRRATTSAWPVSTSASDTSSESRSRPATASAYCMALVRTTRTRSSSLSTGLRWRIGSATSIAIAGELARDVRRQPGARRHRARPGPGAPRPRDRGPAAPAPRSATAWSAAPHSSSNWRPNLAATWARAWGERSRCRTSTSAALSRCSRSRSAWWRKSASRLRPPTAAVAIPLISCRPPNRAPFADRNRLAT